MDEFNRIRHELAQKAIEEPITKANRPYLVKFLKLLINRAQQFSKEDLLGAAGHDVAMSMCGTLAYQGADGVEYDGWLNEQDEPVLNHLFDIVCTLDIDADNPEKWDELFKAADDLN